MRRLLIALGLILIYPFSAYADIRINIRIDFTKGLVVPYNKNTELYWRGLEAEIEKEFNRHNRLGLSGFAIGVRREPFSAFTGFGIRKDVERWDEGTYFVTRVYRKHSLPGSLELNPGVSILYGLPGTTLDKTREYESGQSYVHVFPLRNIDVPKFPMEKAGLIYPELSIALRKKLAKDILSFEAIAGLRIIRFGMVESNINGYRFSKNTAYLPSLGIRLGIKL